MLKYKTKKQKFLQKTGGIEEAIKAHILQNLVMRGLLRFPQLGMGKIVTRAIAAPGQGMKTVGGSALYGAAQGILPEVGILGQHINEFTKTLQEQLVRHGVSLNKLSRKDRVALHYLLQGDFNKFYNLSSKSIDNVIQATIEKKSPEIGALLNKIFAAKHSPELTGLNNISKEQIRAFLTNLGETWKENRLTGNLGRYITKKRGGYAHPMLHNVYDAVGKDSLFGSIIKKPATKRKTDFLQDIEQAKGSAAHPKINEFVENAAEFTSGQAIDMLDPATGMLNGVKWLASTPFVHKKTILGGRFANPLNAGNVLPQVQKELGNVFVTNPLKNSFEKGLSGNRINPMHIEHAASRINENTGLIKKYLTETADSQVMNPVTSTAKDLSNGVGYAAYKAGITPEHIGIAVNAAKEHGLIRNTAQPGLVDQAKTYVNNIRKDIPDITESLKSLDKPVFSIAKPW